MRARSSAIAWSLFAFYVVISVGWIVLDALNGEDVFENVLFLVLYGAFAFVGTLVASTNPGNALGWIFLWIGIGANLGNGSSAYAVYSLQTRPGVLPGGELAQLLGSFLWAAAIVSIVLLLVLFPHGRPQSRFEHWLLRVTIFAIVVLPFASYLLKPGPIEGGDVVNPLGVEALADFLKILEIIAAPLIPVVAITAIGALVVRSRRSHGVERQQLRWFGYSALAMVFVNFVLANVIKTFFPSIADTVGNVGFVIGLSFMPLGTGVAILRYRLFELDLIVNRTLVYGVLTAFLAMVYLSSVFLLQRLLGPITRESDVAVAGSTLAVAALFRPLRTRIQGFIDRRFYRRKYDAAETLSRFSARLRDQVDLDSLSSELVGVVGNTMQPAHASLWLRTPTGAAP